MSERCLTVNVFRPAGLDTAKLVPVMIWIYGGGSQSGTVSVYNAPSIVRSTPIVVLSPNYRLRCSLWRGRARICRRLVAMWSTAIMGQSAGAIGLWHLVLQAAEKGVRKVFGGGVWVR
ncbi:alpha/beta-hydrolase [Exidia glandulosa HHB12029]|uniref:Alpha/beta-hydrolase n=1 Tax=Exidia glandulosa HHB12029 TaxID=1314781 RepID=A0A165ZGV5_EXIGL|nr:alpha/beta-hydrolase [Exidia glandulosa HHB12029]